MTGYSCKEVLNKNCRQDAQHSYAKANLRMLQISAGARHEPTCGEADIDCGLVSNYAAMCMWLFHAVLCCFSLHLCCTALLDGLVAVELTVVACRARSRRRNPFASSCSITRKMVPALLISVLHKFICACGVGKPFWNLLHINPIHDEDGQLVSFVGVQMDVSDMAVDESTDKVKKEDMVH